MKWTSYTKNSFMKEYPKHRLLITQQVYSYTYKAQEFKYNNTKAIKWRQIISELGKKWLTSYKIITEQAKKWRQIKITYIRNWREHGIITVSLHRCRPTIKGTWSGEEALKGTNVLYGTTQVKEDEDAVSDSILMKKWE